MSELDNKIQQMIQGFEALKTIEPTADWQQSVIDKLSTTTRDVGGSYSTKALVVVGLLFIGLNVGFILKETSTKTSARFQTSPTLTGERAMTFETISKELLINPTSTR